MLSKPLVAFATCYNFTILDNYAYGTVKDYVVAVKNDGYKKIAFVAFYNFDEEESNSDLLKFKISDKLKSLELPALDDYEMYDGGLLIRTGCDLKFFDEAVNKVCETLGEFGISATDRCTYCGEKTTLENAYIRFDGNSVRFLCKECTDDFLSSAQAKQTTVKGSKKLGVLASVAAAFVFFAVFTALYAFVIPYDGIYTSGGTLIMKALVLNMPFSAITTVASFLLYRVVTGKKGAERILPCGISAFVASALTSYVASVAVFANQFGLKFAQAKLVAGIILRSPFTDPYLRKDFLQCLIYSALTVIAVVLIYSIIFEDKKKANSFAVKFGETEAVDSVFDTLTEENAVEEDVENL